METSPVDKLCELSDPYTNNPERDALFVEAVKENYAFQLEKQPFIRYLANHHHFHIDRIKTIADIADIPPLFVGIMKIHTFCNFEEKDIEMVLTSSGT
ncbi:MAG: hypothetical protein WCS39_07600, partial [Bacteroidales bacterium]